MNYHRIYEDFIQDRRSRERALAGYMERHHIVPKSFGGGNDPANLIDLTPEDHFFAHLLLARIHGGKMGSALFCMMQVSPNHWGRRHSARRSYGLAKRLAAQSLSEEWSGENNPLFNPKEWDWKHRRTGESVRATLMEMYRRFGGSRPQWTHVAQRSRRSYKGWVLADLIGKVSHSEKGQSFLFVNRDGRTFSGTQNEFVKANNVCAPTASRVVRHESVTRCGWRLNGVMDRPHNYGKDGLPAKAKRVAPSET